MRRYYIYLKSYYLMVWYNNWLFVFIIFYDTNNTLILLFYDSILWINRLIDVLQERSVVLTVNRLPHHWYHSHRYQHRKLRVLLWRRALIYHRISWAPDWWRCLIRVFLLRVLAPISWWVVITLMVDTITTIHICHTWTVRLTYHPRYSEHYSNYSHCCK